MIALPSLHSTTVRSQICSLIRALGAPTKTPGAISINHLVRSPRKPAGTAVTTRTNIASTSQSPIDTGRSYLQITPEEKISINVGVFFRGLHNLLDIADHPLH